MTSNLVQQPIDRACQPVQLVVHAADGQSVGQPSGLQASCCSEDVCNRPRCADRQPKATHGSQHADDHADHDQQPGQCVDIFFQVRRRHANPYRERGMRGRVDALPGKAEVANLHHRSVARGAVAGSGATETEDLCGTAVTRPEGGPRRVEQLCEPALLFMPHGFATELFDDRLGVGMKIADRQHDLRHFTRQDRVCLAKEGRPCPEEHRREGGQGGQQHHGSVPQRESQPQRGPVNQAVAEGSGGRLTRRRGHSRGLESF